MPRWRIHRRRRTRVVLPRPPDRRARDDVASESSGAPPRLTRRRREPSRRPTCLARPQRKHRPRPRSPGSSSPSRDPRGKSDARCAKPHSSAAVGAGRSTVPRTARKDPVAIGRFLPVLGRQQGRSSSRKRAASRRVLRTSVRRRPRCARAARAGVARLLRRTVAT